MDPDPAYFFKINLIFFAHFYANLNELFRIQVLVKQISAVFVCPLDLDAWVRIFLRIRIQEAKILWIQQSRIRILSTALFKQMNVQGVQLILTFFKTPFLWNFYKLQDFSVCNIKVLKYPQHVLQKKKKFSFPIQQYFDECYIRT